MYVQDHLIMEVAPLEGPRHHDHEWLGFSVERICRKAQTVSGRPAPVSVFLCLARGPGEGSTSVMEFFRPSTWADALAIKAGQPGARAIAGGTDVMVEINFDRSRPEALLDLTGVAELAEWSPDGFVIRLGAGVPYTRVI